MSNLSTSNILSQSHVTEPAVLMVEPNIDILASLSAKIRGTMDQDPIVVPYDADYEELKMRVLSNLM